MNKNPVLLLEKTHKVWVSSALFLPGKRSIIPLELEKGGDKTMRENMMSSTVFELENEPRFPNLLNDKDFVSYNWTLPFCNL